MNKIDEIKQALAAATPGPWYVIATEVFIETGPIAKLWGENYTGEFRFDNFENNGKLIAKAPEYITYQQEEIERINKKLEEAIKALEWYADESRYINTKLWPGDPACPAESEVSEDGGERARAFLVCQEGEGNQLTIEVTLINEGYKPHQINWDNEG